MRLILILLLLAAPAWADAPRVVTDIPPVQSLVARVMQGVATPDMVVTGGSAHHASLRPSQARLLQQADLVVWIGPELTPWLGKAVTSYAPAHELRLLQHSGPHLLPMRDLLDADDDDHDHGHDHDHAEGGIDPHAWLDPEIAQFWLGQIAAVLSRVDPEHATLYADNAAQGRAEIAATTARAAQMLAPVRGVAYVSAHDAFQYFEQRFGLSPAGAVTLGDAARPSPARIAELRDLMGAGEITCAFSEPQSNDRLLRTAAGGQTLTIVELDPLGQRMVPGPELYSRLIEALVRDMAGCLG